MIWHNTSLALNYNQKKSNLPGGLLEGVGPVDWDLLKHPFLTYSGSNAESHIGTSGFTLIAHQTIEYDVELSCSKE